VLLLHTNSRLVVASEGTPPRDEASVRVASEPLP
jgi:hypothetical protein